MPHPKKPLTSTCWFVLHCQNGHCLSLSLQDFVDCAKNHTKEVIHNIIDNNLKLHMMLDLWSERHYAILVIIATGLHCQHLTFSSNCTTFLGCYNGAKVEVVLGLHDARHHSHTAQWVGGKVEQTMQEMQVLEGNFMSITSDAGSNIKCCLSKKELGTWVWCGAHLLHKPFKQC